MTATHPPGEDGSLVDGRARCGRNVRLSTGVIVHGACVLGDDCLVGAGAILDAGDGATLVLEDGVELGAGAVLAGALRVGRGAIVRPGAVVTRDVPPHAIVAGNPAQIVGYTGSAEAPLPEASAAVAGPMATRVGGVVLQRLPSVLDLRGNLSVGEFGSIVPFDAKRFFLVFGVPNAQVRGEHAHRTCHQFLVCTHGSCAVVADDGRNRQEFRLDDPTLGLHLPPLTWGVQYRYSPDAVLLVLASEHYDPQEYIRDYAEFLALVKARGA